MYAWVATLAAAPLAASAQAPTYQGALPARIVGPRAVASSAEGEMFVADAAGRLYRLTKKGDIVGQVLDGVVSVTSNADGAASTASRNIPNPSRERKSRAWVRSGPLSMDSVNALRRDGFMPSFSME